MNTIPYTNARREGRTKPGLIEMLAPDDPRNVGPRYVENRADRRARGHRGMTSKGASSRRVHRTEWPPKPSDEDRAALAEFQWRRYEGIEAHESMCSWSDEVSA